MKANKNDNENSNSTLGGVLSLWVYLVTHKYWTANEVGERVLRTRQFRCDLHTAREYVKVHLGNLVSPGMPALIHAYNTLRQLDWPKLQTGVRADEQTAWAWWFTERNAAWDFTAGPASLTATMDLIEADRGGEFAKAMLRDDKSPLFWMQRGAQSLLWWLFGINATFANLQTYGLGGWMAGLFDEEDMALRHTPLYLMVSCPDPTPNNRWHGINSPPHHDDGGCADTSLLSVAPVTDPQRDTSWMVPPEEVMSHPWRKANPWGVPKD